jgi:hypothetical protein
MAWRQPKRNGKGVCGHRGQCSCQRQINAEIAANPAAAPRTCGQMCGWNGKGKPCTGTVRSGKCTCPNC